MCGGKSSRMGQDKAMLPFGPERMLQRVVRLVSEVIPPAKIIVVATRGQALPPLPSRVRVACDEHPDRGPLEGLATGLKSIQNDADVVYLTSCDVPLLEPAVIPRLFDLLDNFQIVIPREGEHLHPLTAVYRTSVLPYAIEQVQADQLRLKSLLGLVAAREVPVDFLRDIDPELRTFRNLNGPDDYRTALQLAGFDTSQ